MKYLMWDFDGTLVYRLGGSWTTALLDVIRREAPASTVTLDQVRPYLLSGFPWHTPERTHTHIKSAEEWWAALDPVFVTALRGVGFAETQARSMAKQLRTIYTEPRHFQLYEDVTDALSQLTSLGWTHVMLTNHVPELQEILRHLKIDSAFARVFNSAETGYEKPNLLAFRNVLDAMSDVQEIWMIGDSYPVDVLGAESAGIPAILVRKHDPKAMQYCVDLSLVAEVVG